MNLKNMVFTTLVFFSYPRGLHTILKLTCILLLSFFLLLPLPLPLPTPLRATLRL